ncbi:hypothetical protein [Microbacterium sp. NPDC058389]|uniref:hypothetical protein n=1 Tax=Microbacterium sp. NPDC058389 TaxID=3346475 RepID=UPI003668E405
MSDWPETMKIGPIREWPGDLTAHREQSRFRVSGSGYTTRATPLSTTLGQLDIELRALRAQNAELLIAVASSDFRLDGRPRATAKAAHPGVILSFDSDHGHLSYPCDTFTTWQDNLRAVALALEALRKVDRYGVTKRGEQYRGFLAIEATAAPAGFATADAALMWLTNEFGDSIRGWDTAQILRFAKRRSHPDIAGGDADRFHRVSLAETKLREAGLL